MVLVAVVVHYRDCPLVVDIEDGEVVTLFQVRHIGDENVLPFTGGDGYADVVDLADALAVGDVADFFVVGVGFALFSGSSVPDWVAVGIGVVIWVGLVMGVVRSKE